MIAPHQQHFAETARPYEGLWHGTGTGKTRTALHTVREHDGSILVIAPKTTVQKKQWQHEAKVLGLHEPVVISKEQFRRDYTELPHYGAVIVDEAHYVFGVTPNTRQRNKVRIPKASQLFEALDWYLKERSPDRLILATATPNKTPMGIWAASCLLHSNKALELPQWDFYEFRNRFYVRLPMDNVIYAPKRTQEAMDDLATLTRSLGHVLRLEDIKDVPEQTFRTVEFDLTAEQRAVLRDLPGAYTDQTALRAKRHQVENGLLYEDLFHEKVKRVYRQTQLVDNEKIDYIRERAIEFPKMVIFANYTAQVESISKALMKDGKVVHMLTGETENRKEMLEMAEAAESAYVVAQAAVSSEWEFKSCPVMIFASLSNKSLDYIQGKGRIQRYDAVKHNLYIHLVTDHKDSIDARWFETIMSGRDFNEALHV